VPPGTRPVVTPGLFRSEECRKEINRFLRRGQELGRSNLILPVYCISARELDDQDLRESDPLAREPQNGVLPGMIPT
jgi:hypothetical protein